MSSLRWVQNLKPLEIYLDWNGPTLLSYVGSDGSLFLACWIETLGERDRWFYVPVSRHRLGLIRSGTLGLRDSIVNNESGILVVSFDQSGAALETNSIVGVALDDLPEASARIQVPGELEHVIGRHERQARPLCRGVRPRSGGLEGP